MVRHEFLEPSAQWHKPIEKLFNTWLYYFTGFPFIADMYLYITGRN